MLKTRFLLLVFTLSAALAACAGGTTPMTSQPEAVLPEPTLTSVFEPMLTPTPTPFEDTPAAAPTSLVNLPALDIPAFTSGEMITPTLVDFFDPLVGWGIYDMPESAISGFVMRTMDGGASWQNVNPPTGLPPRSRFFALDALQAWIAPVDVRPGESVSSTVVLRTADGGQSWQASQPFELAIQQEPLVEYSFPVALFFLDAQHGWLVDSVGHYMNQDVLEIFSTQDGGQTWQRTTDKFSMGTGDAPSMPCRVSGIAFVDAQHGFLAGDCMHVGVNDLWSILETRDGGVSWQRTQLPEPGGVPEAVSSSMSDLNTVCGATGVALTPAGLLVNHSCQLTDNAGNYSQHQFQSLSPDGGITWHGWAGQTASFVDASHGFSLGELKQDKTRELSVTEDGGTSWQVVTTVTWPAAQLDFVSASEGYVLASLWEPIHNVYDFALVRTRDGGKSWELVPGRTKQR